jgi:hypothetical protein
MIVAGIRPRSLTWCPRRLAHALISALRSRPGPVRALRRRPVALTLRAWLVYSRVQFPSKCSAHVDLVRSSLKGERNCLLTLDLAIVREIADDRHLNGSPTLSGPIVRPPPPRRRSRSATERRRRRCHRWRRSRPACSHAWPAFLLNRPRVTSRTPTVRVARTSKSVMTLQAPDAARSAPSATTRPLGQRSGAAAAPSAWVQCPMPRMYLPVPGSRGPVPCTRDRRSRRSA